MKHTLAALLLIPLITSGQIIGKQQAAKIQVAAYGASQNALVSLPGNYQSSTERYPLIIFLHGVGEKGSTINDLSKLIGQGLPKIISQRGHISAINPVDGKLYDFIVVSPQHHAWTTTPESLQFMLGSLQKMYRIDTNRIYLTGLSAGGQGVIQAITFSADLAGKFAAVVPMSPAHPGEQLMKNFRLNKNIAWFFAGDGSGDATYRNNANRYNDSINKHFPGASRVSLFKGGHCCWADVYSPDYRIGGMNIYEWMLSNSRGSSGAAPIDSTKYLKVMHDPAKVKKVIVLDKDGTWTEYDPSSITSGDFKISF